MNIQDLNNYVMLRFLHKPAQAPPTITPEPWMVDALCTQVDPEMFFPEVGGTAHAAKRICAACPVTLECLRYGMTDAHGVYGGLSANERQRLRNGSVA